MAAHAAQAGNPLSRSLPDSRMAKFLPMNHYRTSSPPRGPIAPDGAYDYLAHGRMIGGFALVAFPAQYGVSGVMTFMVNHDGIVYQKDLGPNTATIARAMKHFNPDASWKKV